MKESIQLSQLLVLASYSQQIELPVTRVLELGQCQSDPNRRSMEFWGREGLALFTVDAAVSRVTIGPPLASEQRGCGV